MMGTDILECGLNAWLAMAFMSTGLPLFVALLLVVIAAVGRYVFSGRRTSRVSVR